VPNDVLKATPKASAVPHTINMSTNLNETSVSPSLDTSHDAASGSPNSDARMSEIYRKGSLEGTHTGFEEGFSRASSTSTSMQSGVPTSEDGGGLLSHTPGLGHDFAIIPHTKRQSRTSVSHVWIVLHGLMCICCYMYMYTLLKSGFETALHAKRKIRSQVRGQLLAFFLCMFI
jgi:hypothetical protein